MYHQIKKLNKNKIKDRKAGSARAIKLLIINNNFKFVHDSHDKINK